MIHNLTAEDAGKRHHGGSSFAWTYAHVPNQVDSWVNVRFAGQQPQQFISQGPLPIRWAGDADEWGAIMKAAEEVRAAARTHLHDLSDDDSNATSPYSGSFGRHGVTEINLRYVIYRAVAHHHFHIGEIASKRDLLGHNVGDYPGPLKEAI